MAKVKVLFDFKQAQLPDRLFQIQVKRSAIEKKLYETAERFLTIESQEGEIIKNDIVAVCLKSEKPYLASECERLRVGRGFFYPEVEEALMDKKAGESFSCEIDGEKVEVEILSVKRRVVPALCDAYIKELGLDEISTLAEYTEYVTAELAEEDKEKKEAAICKLVNRQLVEKSEFILEDGEVENSYQEMLQSFEEETESQEEFENIMFHLYHVKDLEAAKKKMKEQVEEQIKLTALAEAFAEENQLSWSEEDYEAFIQASISDKMSEEELREAVPMEDFLLQQKVDYLQTMEVACFEDRFTREVVEG